MQVPATGFVQRGTVVMAKPEHLPPFHPPTSYSSIEQTLVEGLLCSVVPGLDVGVEVIKKNTQSLTSES